jgi:hypothetical protein
MTTITRQQLRDAIEAGIAAAVLAADFPDDAAERLRHVGLTAEEVARNTYAVSGVGCPVAQAFADWRDVSGKWNLNFARHFDRATWKAIGHHGNVLHITDNENEGGA